MNFEFINKITDGKTPELFRSLINGHIRSLTDEQIVTLIKDHALDKRYSTFIFRRVKEINNRELLDNLAQYFLSRYTESSSYKEKRRFPHYLNGISMECSLPIQKEIFGFFLNSGKRYLRKYAYANPNLSTLGLFELAWQLVNENYTEATYLIHTIAYYYNDEFLLNYFKKVIAHIGIKDYQIRCLFKRHPNLTEEDWLWLKRHRPHSFLYVAAIKNYAISNDDCMEVYNHEMHFIMTNQWIQDPMKAYYYGA